MNSFKTLFFSFLANNISLLSSKMYKNIQFYKKYLYFEKILKINCVIIEKIYTEGSVEMENLQEIYKKHEPKNFIEPELYPLHRVKQGLRNDNGTGVKVALTKVSTVIGYDVIDGHKKNLEGRLVYRGYNVEDLVSYYEKMNIFGFERTAFLLIFGKLPTQEEIESFHNELLTIATNTMTDFSYKTSSIMNAMQIGVLKLYGNDENPDNDTLEQRMIKGIHILSSLPLFVFSYYTDVHAKTYWETYPLPNKSFAENILYMARETRIYTPEEVSLVDKLLIVHADHGGGNNSTFTDVVISSTGTDIYSCIAASIGSLKGPKHGGAAMKTYEQFKFISEQYGYITDEKTIEEICNKILDKEYYDNSGLIYGIGHAVYTKSDPRATIIKEECRKLAKEKGTTMMNAFEFYSTFERVAVRVMKERKGMTVCANVDFYSGLAYRMLGFRKEIFTPLFAIARTSGWIAHHLESRQSDRKLIRPAAVYVGKYRNVEEENND